MMKQNERTCVLVFAGLDPSGGAGISADIEAVGAVGSHALPIITALTVQDNNRVYAVNPVDSAIIAHQANVLMDHIPIAAVKIGIVGNRSNALVIRDVIIRLRQSHPELPVVLDTVLGSGHGFALTDGVPEYALSPLLGLATLVTPNLPEAKRLYPKSDAIQAQALYLMDQGAANVLIKGGHGDDAKTVVNYRFNQEGEKSWRWSRLPREFHGTGCTLASAIAGFLAQGVVMDEAIERAQQWCQQTLVNAYTIAKGQQIPARQVAKCIELKRENE